MVNPEPDTLTSDASIGKCIAAGSYICTIRDQYQRYTEIPSTLRRPVGQPLSEYIEIYQCRDTGIFGALASGSCNMWEIGDHVCAHGSRVSKTISQIEKAR